jgi:hypothetical protein
MPVVVTAGLGLSGDDEPRLAARGDDDEVDVAIAGPTDVEMGVIPLASERLERRDDPLLGRVADPRVLGTAKPSCGGRRRTRRGAGEEHEREAVPAM